jgi:hypothetical protein
MLDIALDNRGMAFSFARLSTLRLYVTPGSVLSRQARICRQGRFGIRLMHGGDQHIVILEHVVCCL